MPISDRELARQYQREYITKLRADPEEKARLREYENARRKTPRGRALTWMSAHKYAKKKYGLTVDSFNALVASQKGACAICQKQMTATRDQHVDHDHKTGKIRGVLCASCNHLLGNARDRVDVLERAICYLLENSQENSQR
jgi:recombination endonuclease VII